MYKFIPLLLLFCSCGETEQPSEQVESKIGSYQAPVENHDTSVILDSISKELKETDSNFSHKVTQGEHGWGYEIHKNGAMMIRQMHIPSIPGINGFESEEKATIAADYILKQVEKGNFPPTVNKEILDSLKVL